jgi:hypothetical protein
LLYFQISQFTPLRETKLEGPELIRCEKFQVIFYGMNEEMLVLLVIPAADIGSAKNIFVAAAAAAVVVFLYVCGLLQRQAFKNE